MPFRNLLLVTLVACSGDATLSASSPSASRGGPVAPMLDAGGAQGSRDGSAALTDATTTTPTAMCQKTLCTTGAFARGDAIEFDAICDYPEIASTVVKSCQGTTCFNTFETFLKDPKDIYAELFKALDTNKDGKLDGADPLCEVTLLGFSWGGVAAVQVARLFTTDTNVDTSRRKVKRLVAMDPYQPNAGRLDIPAGVQEFVEFRHTVAPSNDCSKNDFLGPYKGLVPHCALGAQCTDYDYSLAPTTVFTAQAGKTFTGQSVGHCEVPLVADPLIRAMYRGDPLSNLPPTVPVTP
jgi:hypothetical protein